MAPELVNFRAERGELLLVLPPVVLAHGPDQGLQLASGLLEKPLDNVDLRRQLLGQVVRDPLLGRSCRDCSATSGMTGARQVG